MGLPRPLRLGNRRRIREVREGGRRAESRLGGVLLLPGATADSRLCSVFPRHLGTAVRRNRARRRVQEAFRECAGRLGEPWDVIFRARRGCVEAGLETIAAGLQRLLREAGAME
jgi:ribonuclease P protein component